MARCTSGGRPTSPGAFGNTNIKVMPGFTTKYGVDRLVWFENHDDREAALRREKQIKGWRRNWKINLIETQNRYWIDLYENLPDA